MRLSSSSTVTTRRSGKRSLDSSTRSHSPGRLSSSTNKLVTDEDLIEKFEDHAGPAAFAVVLMTPDDEGRALGGDELSPRARQNVILELGFFVGALGRRKVAILYDEAIERPSDIDGVSYIAIDQHGAWRLKLAKEMKGVINISSDALLGG